MHASDLVMDYNIVQTNKAKDEVAKHSCIVRGPFQIFQGIGRGS